MIHYQSFIDGEWMEGEGVIEVIDPSSGEIFATVSKVTRIQLQKAIEGAHRAFQSWSKKPAIERSRVLLKAASSVRENHKEIATLLAREQGKALPDAEREVLGAADCLEYYAFLGVNILGEVPPSNATNLR
ncbi:MAG: aldehyde dehydrogenase family protein, partial [Candidatus Caldatribacteriaceae bacterium]